MTTSKQEYSVYRNDAEVTVTGTNQINRYDSWDEMELNSHLLFNIKNKGFIWPRKIQESVIPYVLQGHDILCQSETGTGKTAAYLIPIIDYLVKLKQKIPDEMTYLSPFCVILAPSREFVQQIASEARELAQNTQISVKTAFGGTIRVKSNLRQLSTGCDILCATIGRLLNLMNHDYEDWECLNMNNLRYIVVDEADHFLLGSGRHDILMLFEHINHSSGNNCQKMFFSPTLQIDRLKIFVHDQCHVTNPIMFTTLSDSNQRIKYEVDLVSSEPEKYPHLTERISNIFRDHSGQCPRILIFVNSKKTVNNLADNLSKDGFPAVPNHSDFNQSFRDKTLSDFRSSLPHTRIMVAVNVCSRGIDIAEMDYVINFDLPVSKEAFIQKCGRTGRIKSGTAISLYVESSDSKRAAYLREILQNAHTDIPEFLHNRMPRIEEAFGNLSMRNQRRYVRY